MNICQFRAAYFNDISTIQWHAKNIIVATGTYEKIIPFEKLTSRFFGLILVFWGSYLIFI